MLANFGPPGSKRMPALILEEKTSRASMAAGKRFLIKKLKEMNFLKREAVQSLVEYSHEALI